MSKLLVLLVTVNVVLVNCFPAPESNPPSQESVSQVVSHENAAAAVTPNANPVVPPAHSSGVLPVPANNFLSSFISAFLPNPISQAILQLASYFPGRSVVPYGQQAFPALVQITPLEYIQQDNLRQQHQFGQPLHVPEFYNELKSLLVANNKIPEVHPPVDHT